MRKLLFYLPAALHTAATLCLNVLSGALIPLWHIWNILFWIAGDLMGRGKAWGCVFGLIPAGMVLWMRGLALGVECAVGLAWLLFYLGCGAVLWRKQNQHSF